VADVPATQVAWTAYVPCETKVKAKQIESSPRKVDYFTSVSTAGYAVGAMQVNAEVQQQAAAAFAGAAAAAGVQPVRVALPIDGWAMMF
jgi:hypothetical protein